MEEKIQAFENLLREAGIYRIGSQASKKSINVPRLLAEFGTDAFTFRRVNYCAQETDADEAWKEWRVTAISNKGHLCFDVYGYSEIDTSNNADLAAARLQQGLNLLVSAALSQVFGCLKYNSRSIECQAKRWKL